jgi:hypothetical protein
MTTRTLLSFRPALIALPAAFSLGTMYSADAQACSAPPPTWDCAAQLTCVLGSPELLPVPDFEGSDPTIGSAIVMTVPAKLHHSFAPPPEGETCFPADDIEVQVWLNCTDAGAGAGADFSGTAALDAPPAGGNLLEVPVTLEERHMLSAVPGDCVASGKAWLETNGVEIEVKCGGTVLSLVAPIDDGTPVLEANFIATYGGTGPHYILPAHVPAPIKVRVRNNHLSESFSGEMVVASNNVNHTAVVTTSGGGLGFGVSETATYSLSEGEGDDFVIQSESVSSDGCFDLPNPEDSISPTATVEFTLEAGAVEDLVFYSRTWPTCADGSCSGFTYEITGSFEEGETISASIGGSLMVVASTSGDPPGGGGSCADSGEETTMEGCGDDESDCGGVVVLKSSLPAAIRGGLVFDSDLIEARPAVVNTSTTASVALAEQSIEEDVRDPSRGRLKEILQLAEPAGTPGELITINSQFSVIVIDGEGEFEVNEVVIGSKYQPEDDDGLQPPSSFIGLGRIEVTTSPYTEVTTQYQAGVWTMDSGGDVVRLEVVDYELTAGTSGFESELTLVVPDFALEEIHLVHDIRGYAWTAYENVCDDVSDNDNDGLVDCDDDDCVGHPACDDEEDTGDVDPSEGEDADGDADGGGDGDDLEDEADSGASTTKDGGCSCAAADGGAVFWFLLPALVVLFRRKELA